MKKFAVLIPLTLMAVLIPAEASAAGPLIPVQPGGSAASDVAVSSVGRVSSAVKAADEQRSFQLDAASIATQTSRPLAQVTAELNWQGEVNQEAKRLAGLYPTTLTGVRILSHEKRSVWVGFEGRAPKVALPFGSDATVVSNQPMSEMELRQATSDVARQARALFGVEVTAAPDAVTRSIDVIVTKVTPADSAGKILQLAAGTVGTKSDSVKLNVTFDPTATSEAEAASGGAKLETIDKGSVHCTSAFSIVRNGVTGMLTAYHCGSTFTHENFDGDTEYSASTVASTFGTNGDLRWYNTPTNEVPQFRANYSDLRNLYTAPGFSEGQWMCHFGYGNGKSCDTVFRIHVSTGQLSNLIAMSHHKTTGGNSGGPWFFGGGGYGVHRGLTTIKSQKRAVFTPLNRVWPAFDAYILVN